MSLSVGNLLIAVGVAFDTQLKAADNLFFAAAVEFDDPTKPQFGGPAGDINGNAIKVNDADATGYTSLNNGIDGDPVTIRQISTSTGPVYQIVNGSGDEIMVEDPAAAGAVYSRTPRYVVKADGIIYDCLCYSGAGGAGQWQVSNPASANGGTGQTWGAFGYGTTIDPDTHYMRPVGRITFKAKEGATLSRASDELQRISQVVQLLTRLLEGIQDESKGFSSIIR